MSIDLEKLPEIKARLDAGQRFNTYQTRRGGWLICLGPVSDALPLATSGHSKHADLIENVLRSAFGQPSSLVKASDNDDRD